MLVLGMYSLRELVHAFNGAKARSSDQTYDLFQSNCVTFLFLKYDGRYCWSYGFTETR